MIRPQAQGLPGSMVRWIPDRSTSGRVWPFLRSAPAEQAPRITFRPWYWNLTHFEGTPRETRRSACVGRLPGNLVYKGQLLEKRGTDGVEALGVGYFFSTYDHLETLRPPRNPPLPPPDAKEISFTKDNDSSRAEKLSWRLWEWATSSEP